MGLFNFFKNNHSAHDTEVTLPPIFDSPPTSSMFISPMLSLVGYKSGDKHLDVPASIVAYGNECIILGLDPRLGIYTNEIVSLKLDITNWLPTQSCDMFTAYLRSLKDVEIVSSMLKDLPPSCFFGCQSLETVTLSAGVQAVRANAFMWCHNLHDVKMEGNPRIGERAFAGTGVQKVFLNNDVGDSAFMSCLNLEEVVLGGETELSSGVFHNCKKLEKVTIEEGITCIPRWTFKNCESLKEIVLPRSVIYVQARAFEGCTNLERIVFKGYKIDFNPEALNAEVLFLGEEQQQDYVFMHPVKFI